MADALDLNTRHLLPAAVVELGGADALDERRDFLGRETRGLALGGDQLGPEDAAWRGWRSRPDAPCGVTRAPVLDARRLKCRAKLRVNDAGNICTTPHMLPIDKIKGCLHAVNTTS